MRSARRLNLLLRRSSVAQLDASIAAQLPALVAAPTGTPLRPGPGQSPPSTTPKFRWYTTTPFVCSAADGPGQGGASAPAEEASEDLEAEILDVALEHVRELGWTTAALRAAAEALQLSPAAAGSFQRGPVQLVEHFNARCNRQLEELLKGMAPQLAGMRGHERVAAGAKLRLQMIIPYIDSWPQALALQAQPASLLHSARQYGETADIIWLAAGDKSTDYNWYTKRGLLVGCHVSTELFMLTDCSPDYDDTWAALGRRLQDVMAVGKAAGQAGSAAGAAADAAGAVLQQLSVVLGQRPHRP